MQEGDLDVAHVLECRIARNNHGRTAHTHDFTLKILWGDNLVIDEDVLLQEKLPICNQPASHMLASSYHPNLS